MDILIKGVKMPKKGQYLQILIAENGEMSYEHVYYDSPRVGFKLHKSKAVALPSHGRLCDLDYLIEHETYNIKQALFDSDEVLEDLKNAPVIVEATE